MPTQPIDLSLIREWLKQAGDVALSRRDDIAVNLKADNTPLTAIDLQIETFLLDCISQHYPHHRVITEEGGIYPGDSEFVWIIDPIDGTRAFASGLPIWGISIGVLWKAKPYLGAFYMPALREMYWGSAEGAFCNSLPISRRSTAEFDDPLVFFAVPSDAHRLYKVNFPRLRSLGSTAAHLVYVARGAAIGALTRKVKIWDLAGVLPILNQMGITLLYLSGKPFCIGELLDGRATPEPIVAAPSNLIQRVRANLRLK